MLPHRVFVYLYQLLKLPMRKNIVLLFVLLPFSFLLSFSQTKELDSIKVAINNHKQHDSTRLFMLVDYVLGAVNVNTSQALPYMLEVVSLSKELNNTRGIEVGYIYLQLYYSDRGDFAQSNLYADTAIFYLDKDTNRFAKVNLGYLLNNLGGDNIKMGDYARAIDCYTKAAEIFEKYDPDVLSSAYGGMASVYDELLLPDKSIEYNKKAIKAAENSNNKATIGRQYLNYADRLIKKRQYSEAEAILKKTEPVVFETKDVISMALFYQVRGFINQYKKQFRQAIPDFKAAYQIGIDNDDKYQQIALLDPLVKSLIEAGEMDEARRMNDTLLHKSLLYNMNFGRLNAYTNMAKWYLVKNDYANAYLFLEKKTLLADSVSSDELKKKIALAEVRYKLAGKDREIQTLQAEKQIQNLQLRQKNILNYILVSSAVSLLIILVLFYRNYQNRQKIQQQRINELEKEKQLAATEAILKGEEKERSRLAQDLHDGLGGMLSGIKHSLNNMKENLIMTPDNANAFEHSINMLDNSISEMRRVAHNLMPENLLKFGLAAAMQDYCSEMQLSGMLQVHCQFMGLKDKAIDQSLSVTVYRVTQELLNNIIKHAGATQAIVQIGATEKQLTITVEDNGKGMANDEIKLAKGIGWKNIYSRVQYHKGTVNVQSQPGKGTSVFIEFPLV